MSTFEHDYAVDLHGPDLSLRLAGWGSPGPFVPTA